jgi:hypothetical protein
MQWWMMKADKDEVRVRHFTASRREAENAHDIVEILGRGRRIEVSVSSTGRAVHVWVDGEHMEARHG